MNTHLFITDPQNDFCDPASGALYVKGAERDMLTLAAWLEHAARSIDTIHVTLDSHQSIHIAHPVFWQDHQGRHPAPFTQITRSAVEAGGWTTTNPQWQARGLHYVRALEQNRRYELTIWPPHCRVGTWGHGIFPRLSDALIAWEEKLLRRIDFILKGNNPFTEHYSAVVADVPDPADPATHLNARLINSLKKADQVLITGEALSHCVANTVTDLADYLGPENIGKLALLRDTTSCVAGCDALGEKFLEAMARRGMRLVTTRSWDRA